MQLLHVTAALANANVDTKTKYASTGWRAAETAAFMYRCRTFQDNLLPFVAPGLNRYR